MALIVALATTWPLMFPANPYRDTTQYMENVQFSHVRDDKATDAWNTPYRWSSDDIRSAGADGQFGTGDDIERVFVK